VSHPGFVISRVCHIQGFHIHGLSYLGLSSTDCHIRGCHIQGLSYPGIVISLLYSIDGGSHPKFVISRFVICMVVLSTDYHIQGLLYPRFVVAGTVVSRDLSCPQFVVSIDFALMDCSMQSLSYTKIAILSLSYPGLIITRHYSHYNYIMSRVCRGVQGMYSTYTHYTVCHIWVCCFQSLAYLGFVR
jgi:hypothetical protein